MKKILLATTVLAASAGGAFAEMSVSGSAEIGIFGGTGLETQLHTDVDVTFTGTGETDGGLAFGFNIDLDESDGSGSFAGGNTVGSSPAFAAATQGGESIFISGNFGTLTWGDTDGAFDWALTEVGIGGSIADDHTSHAGYSGNSGLDGTYDGQIVRYDYSFGNFSVAGSVEMDDTFGTTNDPVFGIGGKFSAQLASLDLGVGLGYQTNGVNDIFGISLDTSFANGFQAIVNYSDLDGVGGNDSHTAIGLGYSAGAITVGFNYGVYARTVGADNSGWGLAADYDLGGGAQIQFGYGSSDTAGVSTDSFSLGVAMSF